ncbi:MAG: hypothetical protein V4677_09435 [Bacteroidota bacterium]
MIFILKRLAIIIFLFGILTAFNSCSYLAVFIMAKEKKTTVDKWESGKYKTRIQKRIGWSSTHFYHCRVQVKRLGGLYYRTVVVKIFSRENYASCLIKCPFRNDTLAVDVCKKTTVLIK